MLDKRQVGDLALPRSPGVAVVDIDPNEVLRHVKVVEPACVVDAAQTARLEELTALLVDTIAANDRSAKASDASATCDDAQNTWLAAVPRKLRGNLTQSVEYLCMLIAVDFRHWDEETNGAAVADVGQVVQQKNFWARVASSDAPHREKDQPCLVRGSAAMVYLLREAVDTHGVLWYDSDYIGNISESLEAAMAALRHVFTGVEEDGATPMCMPAYRERVSILVELARTKRRRIAANANGADGQHARSRACGYETFLSLMQASNYRLFAASLTSDEATPPPPPSAPAAGTPFLDALLALHPRYNDTASLAVPQHLLSACAGGADTFSIYFLKLAQLTVVAVEAAFPGEIRFVDSADLSVCSDYQLPKALRVAGLIVYDATLAAKVDSKTLLSVGGEEEVEIRVASTIAAKRLMRWVDTVVLQRGVAQGEGGEGRRLHCDVGSLDYALWFFGRSFKGQAHHLCRTVMY